MIIERELNNNLHGDCVNADYTQVTAVKLGIKEYNSPFKSSLNGSPLAWFGIVPAYNNRRSFIADDGVFEYSALGRMWLWL